MRTPYPPIEPNRSGYLAVTEVHSLYWEESGNPNGKPVLFLHGGPGSGTGPAHRCFFHPSLYRIILFDQRGCGKSTPHAHLEENTTWDLVQDIEKLREHLSVDRWVVFGGSWGSTLSLAYAETHPSRVLALILRGIFLGRKKDLDWFFKETGGAMVFPDEWDKFIAPISKAERKDLIKAYFQRLTSSDREVRERFAKIWSGWEAAALRLRFDPTLFNSFTDATRADAIARIECHYFMNGCFFEADNWLIKKIAAIKEIPGAIIHGRYDMVCPMDNAWTLHKAWPKAFFEIIPDAGHASNEVGIADALVRATDFFAAQ